MGRMGLDERLSENENGIKTQISGTANFKGKSEKEQITDIQEEES